jgi:predicted GNAT superfamily acetyltransferase
VHQWAWALARGIERISWTYDPLVRRNAFFNLARLRATPTAYLPDYYGTLSDTINAEAPTDRLLVTWPVLAAESLQACSRRAAVPDLSAWRATGATIRVSVGPHGEPVEEAADDAPTHLVGTPADITALRATCPNVARAWRSAMEQHLGAALAGGAHIRGFTPDGYYVVEPSAASGAVEPAVTT